MSEPTTPLATSPRATASLESGPAREGRVTVPHGGNLAEAVQRYGEHPDGWLDLSTGINPHGYPVPATSPAAWQRLPDERDDLEALAAHYYGAPQALAVAGSQPAIRALPALLPNSTNQATAIATLTYGEYLPAFLHAGHRVVRYGFEADPVPGLTAAADFCLSAARPLPQDIQHLVLVNPNNPTARHVEPATVLAWHAQLAARGGSLIVDEAFADVAPEFSVARFADRPGLIVLRSIGKFFGLAGARAGFVLATAQFLATLRAELGPWTLSGPTREAVRAALVDQSWQHATRARLALDGERLAQLLMQHDLPTYSTPLFAWVAHANAVALQQRLAQHAIWVRRFDTPASLRFGLPASEADWRRLEQALQACAALIASSPYA